MIGLSFVSAAHARVGSIDSPASSKERHQGLGSFCIRHAGIRLRPVSGAENAIDWVYPKWNSKAAAFVSYGSVMGARAVQQLRETAMIDDLLWWKAALKTARER